MKLFKKYIIKYRWFNADCYNEESGFLIDKKTILGKYMRYILTALCRPDREKLYHVCIIDRLNHPLQYEVKI